MLPKSFMLAVLAGMPVWAAAQQAQQSPPVKVNVLNVCSPSADEQKELASALAKVPRQPVFGTDFEVARGRSSLSDKASLVQAAGGNAISGEPITAAWVRIRRDFSAQSLFSNVQYSFSTDPNSMIETLVLHVRDAKDLVQLSIEDTASAVTDPASMLATSTPVDRIRVERFGKPSVVLARCMASASGPAPDQSAYEPLFRDATLLLGRYRDSLGARRTVPEELAKVATSSRTAKSKLSPKPAAKKAVPEKK